MNRLEEDVSFDCPHCAQSNVVRIDFTAGKKQKFTVDCENCCHPILIRLEVSAESVENFTAEKE